MRLKVTAWLIFLNLLHTNCLISSFNVTYLLQSFWPFWLQRILLVTFLLNFCPTNCLISSFKQWLSSSSRLSSVSFGKKTTSITFAFSQIFTRSERERLFFPLSLLSPLFPPNTRAQTKPWSFFILLIVPYRSPPQIFQEMRVRFCLSDFFFVLC